MAQVSIVINIDSQQKVASAVVHEARQAPVHLNISSDEGEGYSIYRNYGDAPTFTKSTWEDALSLLFHLVEAEAS